MEEVRKILSEGRINTNADGKIIEGFLLVLAGPIGTPRQEIVYLGRSVGDPNPYSLEDKDRMFAEAKSLFFELGDQVRTNESEGNGSLMTLTSRSMFNKSSRKRRDLPPI